MLRRTEGATARHQAWPLLSLALVPAPTHAQRDMAGPDWIALLPAIPKLIVYAVGEIALVLLPVFALLTLMSWLAGRRGTPAGGGRARYRPTRWLAALTAITALPASMYLMSDGRSDDFGAGYLSTTARDRPMQALAAPNGKPWPETTGYLDMPQSADDGFGVILASRRAGRWPAYVKLCVAGEIACPGLRHAFVLRHQEFIFGGLAAGSYEVRYIRVDRPTVAGRSRPIVVSGYAEDPHRVVLQDSPTVGSADFVAGILPERF